MIGDFFERITIKPLTKSANTTGGNTETYATNNLTRWAMVTKVSTKKSSEDGLMMKNTYKFTIRYDTSVENVLDKTSLISYDSEDYVISDFSLSNNIKSTDFYEIIATTNG